MQYFSELSHAVQVLYFGAGLCALWLVISIVGYSTDRRELFGENVWVKALRFSSSLCIHYCTYAIVLSWLSPSIQTHAVTVFSAYFVLVSLVWIGGYIGVQAARGEPSHFNMKTKILRFFDISMAVVSSFVTAPMAILGTVALLDEGFMLPDAVRYAVGLGLIIGTVLTFISAYHIGVRQNPMFGDKPTYERRLPVFDWSLDRGDLRPAHFFSTHMMQALPIIGFLASVIFQQGVAISVVIVVTFLWTKYTIDIYRNAISGIPFQNAWKIGRRLTQIKIAPHV